MAIEVAREHCRWAFKHGLTRDDLMEAIGRPKLARRRPDKIGSVVLATLAAEWLGLKKK